MKIGNFWMFILLIVIAHGGAWFQLNGQFIDNRFKTYSWVLILCGIPLSWLWIKSTTYGVDAFDGQFWPQRFIAFSIGILFYTLLTYLFFGEKLDMKSLICLILSFSIVVIQVFWK